MKKDTEDNCESFRKRKDLQRQQIEIQKRRVLSRNIVNNDEIRNQRKFNETTIFNNKSCQRELKLCARQIY